MDKTSSMYLYVKLNWDANRFLPIESKDCMNSASYEYRNMSARRGAQFVPMGMPKKSRFHAVYSIMTSFMTLSHQCKHRNMVPPEAPYPDVYTDTFIFFLRSLWKIIWMNVHLIFEMPLVCQFSNIFFLKLKMKLVCIITSTLSYI